MRHLALVAAFVIATPAAAQQYPNPGKVDVEHARSRGPCADPWVTIALEQSNKQAAPHLCNINLYANANWRNYDELYRAVHARHWVVFVMRKVLIGGQGPLAGRTALGVFSAGELIAVGGRNLVTLDEGLVVPGEHILCVVKNALVSLASGRCPGRVALVVE